MVFYQKFYTYLAVVHVKRVRLCLWTAVTNKPIVHPPGGIWVWRTKLEWYWQGKTEYLGEKPVPEPLCPPQIPHGLKQARTRASEVRGRRITARAMARPFTTTQNKWQNYPDFQNFRNHSVYNLTRISSIHSYCNCLYRIIYISKPSTVPRDLNIKHIQKIYYI
jgi:hypothetical protein